MIAPSTPSPSAPGTSFVSTAFGEMQPGVPGDDVLTLPVGSRIAEFVITGLVGIGGFGIVYKAHDESLDRIVALKEYMPASLAFRQEGQTVSVKSRRHAETFQAGLKSFVNEARMLALFDHPALVKVYRFWEANGTAYMVMPLFEGQTLKNALASQAERPPQAWLLQLLSPLLEALQILHAKNCFHRDIAPDNIFLQLSGQPVLLDFGAARQVIGDMANNLTVILKPGYAPIEQYASDPNMPQGAWTDIYALAAVLYHAITGKPPSAAVGRLVKDSVLPLAGNASFSAYDPGFLQAIDQALAVKQAERPQSVADFKALLGLPGPTTLLLTPQPLVSEQAAAPAQPTPAVAPPRPSASATGRLIGVGTVLALLLAGGGYYYVSQSRPSPLAEGVGLASAPPPASTQVASAPPAGAPVLPAASTAWVPNAPLALAPATGLVVVAKATAPASAPQPLASQPKLKVNPGTAAVPSPEASRPRGAALQPQTPPPEAPTRAQQPVKQNSEASYNAPMAPPPSAAAKPEWLTELRKRLASCEEKHILERVFCIERARRKICAPDHWDQVDECRLNNGPNAGGR